MIYKFAIGLAIAFFLGSFNFPQLGTYLLSSLYNTYPGGFPGLALLLLRVSTGALFILHGYPKITHLRQWAESLKMPVFLCFLSVCVYVRRRNFSNYWIPDTLSHLAYFMLNDFCNILAHFWK